MDAGGASSTPGASPEYGQSLGDGSGGGPGVRDGVSEGREVGAGDAGVARHVYVLGASRDGPLKIGIATDPSQRLRTLQIGNPATLSLYWVFPYICPSRHAERWENALHRIFAPWRLQGEWFGVPIEYVVAAIHELGSIGCDLTDERAAQAQKMYSEMMGER